MAEDILYGRNSVLEALKSGRGLNRIYLQNGLKPGTMKDVFALAKELGVPIENVEAERLDVLTAKVRHQGVAAVAAPIRYYELREVLAVALEKGQPPFLLLLDELQDPQNVGAIIRTAAAAGVHGVLIPKRRSCQISAAVSRASAGAVEHVPIVRVGNTVQTLEELKRHGLWIGGADMSGTEYMKADLKGPLAIVIGGEGKGLSRLVRETCDFILSIPMLGGVSSLNASAASAVLLYEAVRQRKEVAR